MPGTNDGDLGRQEHRLVQVVRYKHARGAQSSAQRGKAVLQVGARDGVERAERFVEKQDPRLGGERASDGDALTLATGQFTRPTRCKSIGGEADERQGLTSAFRDAWITVKPQHELDVPLRRPVREKAAILWHVSDGSTEPHGVDGSDVDVADANGSAIRLDETIDAAKQGGLSGAALADERQAGARRHVDRDVVERDDVSESLADVREGERYRSCTTAVSSCSMSRRASHIGLTTH